MLDLRTAKASCRQAEDTLVEHVKVGRKFSDTSVIQTKKEIEDIRSTLRRIENALEHVRP